MWNELDVGLIGKIGMVADLFADVVPTALADGEVKVAARGSTITKCGFPWRRRRRRWLCRRIARRCAFSNSGSPCRLYHDCWATGVGVMKFLDGCIGAGPAIGFKWRTGRRRRHCVPRPSTRRRIGVPLPLISAMVAVGIVQANAAGRSRRSTQRTRLPSPPMACVAFAKGRGWDRSVHQKTVTGAKN